MAAQSPVGPLRVNRAPVLTLWAAVVAERLGHEADTALTLGRALAGLNAQSKGRSLGIYRAPKPSAGKPHPGKKPTEPDAVDLMQRRIPVVKTPRGVRALERGKPSQPEAVAGYLESKFGEHLGAVRRAMTALARSYPKAELEERAFGLYEAFRPEIPRGRRGWGAAGELDLARIRSLARKR